MHTICIEKHDEYGDLDPPDSSQNIPVRYAFVIRRRQLTDSWHDKSV